MYHISKRLEGADFETVVADVREALTGQGFGVLTEIDVQSTLREKLGEEIGPYLILGACNPPLAHRAIGAAPEIGVLLPCNVVVRVAEGAVVVDAMDPAAVMAVVETPGVAEVAAEVRDRLATVVEILG
ncbi:MAG TPA: DUF302 domain-containing protein [Acidimicrobiia bacterium]|nr:DUF302 domain-containing protein [Acidimicrobiia bacterium]